MLHALAVAAALCWAAAGRDPRFTSTLAPHFDVSHEAPWLAAGFSMSLEKLHSRLRMDLAMFSPWMARERIKLFVYADKSSYLGGRFLPPKWSNGIALFGERTVAVYQQQSPRRLLEIIAHETTHLLFESYWGEQGKSPPPWLNEGLAMVEEAEVFDLPERSGWYQSMPELARKGYLPLDAFFAITPTQDIADNRRAVETWYVQAYAIAHFLLRRHSRLQFRNLCAELRDGKSVRDALWRTYRYRDLAQFESAWLDWVRDPAHPQRASASFAREPEPVAREPIGTIPGFKRLRRPGARPAPTEDE